MTHALSSIRLFVMMLATTLVGLPLSVSAHGGHGNEFQSGNVTPSATQSVTVDRTTAQRLGLTIAPVTRQRLSPGVKTTGQLEASPNQLVEVTTPVKGTVIKLLVQPGDTVQAGQPVAIMSSPELAELRTDAADRKSDAIAAVQQAQADLQLAQRNLEQQRKIVAANIQQAQTEVRFAQERYDKDQALVTSGAIPRRTFLESETKLAEAKAALAKAASALEVSEAQAQLQRAQSALDAARSRVSLSSATYQTRLRQLGAKPNPDGTLTITAPIAGTIADRETTQGESGEDAGKKIMTIINGRSLQVSANVYEKDLKWIRLGQPVRIQVNGIPNRVFVGKISVIGARVEGDSRVIPVKANLDNADGVLKPGMFADLEIATQRAGTTAIAIPKSAIVTTNTQQKVAFVQNGSAFEPTEVVLGQESGDQVEVKSGLFEGDLIVTQGAPLLYAQTLRATPQADDHAHAEAATSPAAMPLPTSWWLMLPFGGVVVAGTFWAGTQWAKRGTQSHQFLPQERLDGSSSHPFNPDRVSAPIHTDSEAASQSTLESRSHH